MAGFAVMPSFLPRSVRVLSALAVLIAPASADADDVVAVLARDTPIAAFGGVVAWSDYDAASGRHRLVIRHGQQAALAPIAPARRAFDVSLGPDSRGRVVALYTRCRTRSRGCDVYRYDVRAGRERKLGTVSSPGQDEAWPAQWGRRVVFVRRAKAYVIDGHDHRPDPRGRRGGGPRINCDIPFVKTLSSRRASQRLDRARCGMTTGMSIRGESIVQVTDENQGGAGSETDVRRLRARGGAARVLARGIGGEGGYSPFASPTQSASAVYVTRIGNREPVSFLRIDLTSRRRTEVDPKVALAGPFARDERGTFWYVQAPDPPEEDFERSAPFCTADAPSFEAPLLQPCRLVRASASPFSSKARTLAARLRLSDRAGAITAGLVVVSGDLSREVVRRSATVGREPLASVAIALLRNTRADGTGPYATTGLTTTTDAAGRWSLSFTPPPEAHVAAVAPALGLASPALHVTSDARSP